MNVNGSEKECSRLIKDMNGIGCRFRHPFPSDTLPNSLGPLTEKCEHRFLSTMCEGTISIIAQQSRGGSFTEIRTIRTSIRGNSHESYFSYFPTTLKRILTSISQPLPCLAVLP